MPTYTVKHTKTGKEQTQLMSWDELQRFLEAHPLWEQAVCSAPIVSGVMGSNKPSEGFRDHLREMKKKVGRGNTINVW